MKVKMFGNQRTSLFKLSHYNPTLRLDTRFFKINIVQIKLFLINLIFFKKNFNIEDSYSQTNLF